jgi:hypothetical protein
MAILLDPCRETAPAEGKTNEIGQPAKIGAVVRNGTCRKA